MRISRSAKKTAVITSGDPSGIGPEIILKALVSRDFPKNIIPLVIGDYGVFRKVAKTLKLRIPDIKSVNPQTPATVAGWVNFIDMKNVSATGFRFGRTDKIYGRASMEYLSLGVRIVKEIKNSALVTAPINKEAIRKAGYKCAGHTEFLSEAAGLKEVTMMLAGGNLRVALVTRHIPLKDVPKALTKEKIIKTAENTHKALRAVFKIKHPAIGIAALNPHAGEGGVMGKEEKLIIAPAVKALRKRFKGISGPFPADTLFYKAYKGKFDAVVCMYHDQGLIPLKMVAFDKGVNITLGLPFIRTSPDHGTGFDIAGKGIANPSSMLEAIKLAAS